MKPIKMQKSTVRNLIICLLVITFFAAGILFLYIRSHHTEKPVVKNGTIDISSWDLDKNDLISLNGNWEFYWNKIITYSEFQKNTYQAVMGKVPDVWNHYRVNGANPTGTGKATYRLHVKNAVEGEKLSLNLQSMSTAYRLYIDSKLIAACGTLSDDGTFSPKYKAASVDFTVPDSQFDIIVHVENQVYARGGIWQSIRLGTPSDTARLSNFKIYKDLFIEGCLFILLTIFLIFFFLVKHERYPVYLFVAGFLIFIRCSLHGSYTIYSIYPDVPFDMIIRTDYLMITLIPLFVVCFVKSFFGDTFHKNRIMVITFLNACLGVFTFLSPLALLTSLISVYELIFLLVGIYGTARILKEWNQQQTGTRVIIIGSISLLLLSFYDILYQASVIDSDFGDTFPVGFVIMVLCAVVVFIKRYDEYVKSELFYLKAQIRPHFIHNALNTILIISRSDPDRSRALLIDFSNYLRGCYDLKNLDELIPLEKELEHVRSYAEIEKARFGDQLNVEYQIDSSNIKIPYLTLQPLVENAIVHGIRAKEGGGTVTVYSKEYDKMVRVGVRDNGAGFQKQKTKHLGGSGIGMENINKRLRKICKSQLIVSKNVDGGCDIYYELRKRES